MRRPWWAFALALALHWPAQPWAGENTRFEWLWLQPEGEVAPFRGGLLSLPAEWRPEHMAVLLAFDGSAWPAAERDNLLAAFLMAGMAVMELDGDIRLEARGRAAPAPDVATLARAAVAMRARIGVGPTAEIGHGGWADVAMAHQAGPAPAPAIAAALAAGRAEFRAGGAAAAPRGAAQSLCAALAIAEASGPTPRLAAGQAATGPLERGCRAGLLGHAAFAAPGSGR